MPRSLQHPLRYGIISYHFMDETMYVWSATTMRLEDEAVAKLCSAILSDALEKARKFAPDFPTVGAKLKVGILAVGVNAALVEPMAHQLKVIEGTLWPEGQRNEPRPHADLYFGRRATSPIVRAILETRAALSARDLDIREKWRWSTFGDRNAFGLAYVASNDNERG